jgi:hypothetical protein
MKDPTRTDFLLWLILSGGLAGAIVAAMLVGSIASGGLELRDIPRALPGLLVLIAPCAVVGWFAQLIVTSFGLRLSGRPRPDQAADYDDGPTDRRA